MAPSEYHYLNGVVYLGRNPDSSHRLRPQPTEAFPPLSPDHSDIVCEHDVMLPIKGKCMRTLEALRSDLWLWALGLSCGDLCLVVDEKAGLSFRDIVSVSKGKTTFTPFLLLSLLKPNSLCTATTFWLRTL